MRPSARGHPMGLMLGGGSVVCRACTDLVANGCMQGDYPLKLPWRTEFSKCHTLVLRSTQSLVDLKFCYTGLFLSLVLSRLISTGIFSLSIGLYYSLFNSSNLAFIVGLSCVNFLIVKSSAFWFASRRLLSEDNNASFVFCK